MTIPADYWSTAKKQLALDLNCPLEVFIAGGITVVENKALPGRRIYTNLEKPFFQVYVFAGSAVFSVHPQLMDWCASTFTAEDIPLLFTIPRLQQMEEVLRPYGHKLYDLHYAYLPAEPFQKLSPASALRWYSAEELEPFRGDSRFSNALGFHATAPDKLAVAALEGENIMGMAGVSGDGKDLWQIGVDVLPAYRGKGIARELVTLLKQEVLSLEKVPFYGMVSSNVASRTVAQKSGFLPAWVSLYSTPIIK